MWPATPSGIACTAFCSRLVYTRSSKLMPVTKDTTSFFSFYDVTEKIAIVIGMFSFGFIESVTGSMRNSIIALITFFALGTIVLYLAIVKAKKEHLQSTVI
jgi:UMF1 family MFS transporter